MTKDSMIGSIDRFYLQNLTKQHEWGAAYRMILNVSLTKFHTALASGPGRV